MAKPKNSSIGHKKFAQVWFQAAAQYTFDLCKELEPQDVEDAATIAAKVDEHWQQLWLAWEQRNALGPEGIN